MAAKRYKPGTRRGAKRKSSGGIPAWFWLLGGILIGLGAALVLMMKGYLPELKQHMPSMDSKPPGASESALIDGDDTKTAEPKKPRYDFFTVLPEMEVVVPEQELSRKAEPAGAATAGSGQDSYVLQVGSFRSAADAEQIKAQLALLGSMATVQTVTVDTQTWHRVRVGPYKGARRADEMRRLLSDNKFNPLVIKVKTRP